jgi:hypothetical protein
MGVQVFDLERRLAGVETRISERLFDRLYVIQR